MERPSRKSGTSRGEGAGIRLRSTRGGALVVETEAARRMMQRLRDMKDAVAEPVKDAVADDAPGGTAPAGR